MKRNSVRDQLIAVGIEEVQQHGVQDLSLRQIAQRCGVSCAAPYNHFRNKEAFLQDVAEAINTQWFERQAEALQCHEGDVAGQLRTVCREYLRFLSESPNLCALVTQRDDSTGRWRLTQLFDHSDLTKKLIREYIEEYHLSEQESNSRIYVIRAILYGAAMMNQSDEMKLTEPVLERLFLMIDSQIQPPVRSQV